MRKDNSIKKDVGLALFGILGFYVILLLSNWIDNSFGLSEVYSLVDIASVILKVTTASTIAWVLKRVVFSETLGKDFGGVFNEGWSNMSLVEKTRWILVTFLILFTSILFVR